MSERMLFKPIRIGSLDVPGRVWKTATSETRATADGFVGDEFIRFYEPIAWAGTPLIITGNLYVGFSGKPTYRNAGIDADDKIPGLTRLVDTVHRHGSLIVAQINHCGRQMNPEAIGVEHALSASDVRDKAMFTKPRAMTITEIQRTIEEFASAAWRAKQAGFDGVQVHFAHGYLLSEFLTPHTNRRKDAYGGSFENRLRFPLEVMRAVRARVGADYPVLAKINGADLLMVGNGLTTGELVRVAKVLEAEGLDALEISCGHYESGFPMIRGRFDTFFEDQMAEGAGQFMSSGMKFAARLANKPLTAVANRLWPTKEGFNLEFARQFKSALQIPVITVGGFYSESAMENAIRTGDTDVISIARAMIADPFMVKHLREGTRGPQCDFCNGCIARAGGKPVDCYNEALRPEREAMLAAAGFSAS
ncbi:NADH:flavin oxidoreductase [gamma proteobacterium HdN1]|nr:NADH:flavin oxidoreductase [gamma proteobacterium HdN1]